MKVFKRHLAPGLVIAAAFFLLLGTPLYVLAFQSGWDVPSVGWAAITQCVGSALACLWGSWVLGKSTNAQEQRQLQEELLRHQLEQTSQLDKLHRQLEQGYRLKKET